MKTIKVKDLINALNAYDPEMSVFVSSDSEGNSYSTIDAETSFEEDGSILVLYPSEEGLEYDDLPMYKA